ncbi:MAG: hypothetical protein GY925_07010 [Actinomycetia bacterium]|nr:hypothetical protein [Actinomycetes bacterium]
MFRSAGRVGTTLIHVCLDPWIGLAGLVLLMAGLVLSVGFAITAVGVAFAQPKRRVMVVTGDGSS